MEAKQFAELAPLAIAEAPDDDYVTIHCSVTQTAIDVPKRHLSLLKGAVDRLAEKYAAEAAPLSVDRTR